jgi:hypothetical protein
MFGGEEVIYIESAKTVLTQGDMNEGICDQLVACLQFLTFTHNTIKNCRMGMKINYTQCKTC